MKAPRFPASKPIGQRPWQRVTLLEVGGYTPRLELRCLHCGTRFQVGGREGDGEFLIAESVGRFVLSHASTPKHRLEAAGIDGSSNGCDKLPCPASCGCVAAAAAAAAKQQLAIPTPGYVAPLPAQPARRRRRA